MKFRKESPNALRWRFEVGSVCTFTATKSRENMTGTVRRVCRNVNRWRNAAMALRWTAAGMMEAPQQVAAYGSGKGIMRRRCWIGRRYGLFPSV